MALQHINRIINAGFYGAKQSAAKLPWAYLESDGYASRFRGV